jgi:sulfatase modifying factor 1
MMRQSHTLMNVLKRTYRVDPFLARRDFLAACCVGAAGLMMGCDKSERATTAPAGATTQATAAATQADTGVQVQIPAGEFVMGAIEGDPHARTDESPRHRVAVDAFWMDQTEVTNAQFKRFVAATGYKTTAERPPDWEELRKQLPPGTPKPPDDVLVAGSIVFQPPTGPVPLENVGAWWAFVAGASWRTPHGPGSSIDGKDNFPVVQISWDDASAYAKWAGKRLPTEAEWEWAARGGLTNEIFAWGNEGVDQGKQKANIYQGHFPDRNEGKDGFMDAAPVKSFAPNGYGLYDMAGNVWEWCSDWYNPAYYGECAKQSLIRNPTGPTQSFDPDEPTVAKRVQRGGSFLCHESYCASYRASARMKASPDTGLSHSGFRCVR